MNRTLLSIPKNWVVAFSFKKLDVILQLLHSVILRLEHRTTKFMGRGACSLLEWVYWNVEGFSPRINGEEDNTKIKADFQELLVMGIKIRILLHEEGGVGLGGYPATPNRIHFFATQNRIHFFICFYSRKFEIGVVTVPSHH